MQFTNIPPQVGILLVLLPLYSLSSKITFIKKKHSFLEHLTAMIYLFSTWIIVFIFIDIIQRFLLGNILDEGMFILFMIVLFLWNTRVQAPYQKIVQLLLLAVVQVIILLLIVAVIALFFYFFLPESMTISP